jgi:aspartyl-tRNA(Asn)/glutamyl-tRNA(Gln) amidotransferase subunit A
MDWLGQTAAVLGRAVARGEADPVEVAEAFLQAIEAHEHGARIYVRTTPERARAEAAAARDRARAGLSRGPLDGVPISWKDLFDTAGTRTEAGTALMAGRVPARDAAVLEEASHAGTVCLGKTHMTEIAFSGLGLNPVTATPPNVHDETRLAGGSSSGAAASVAHGLAAAAVGSDTGGSVRLPAAWNDLVGWKPAHGALGLRGVVPLAPAFDTVGPITRDVEDAALLWAALGGPRVDLAGASLEGVTVGVLRTVVTEEVEDAPARALLDALARLERAGARLVDLFLPDLPRAYALGQPLYAGEVWAHWGEAMEAGSAQVFPPVLARASAGREVSAAEYLRAWAALRAIREEAWQALRGVDAVACATCAILPPLVAAVEADHEAFRVANLAALRNTRMANLLDLCSVSLPTGTPCCGLMLSAPPGREGGLLRLARAAEKALA